MARRSKGEDVPSMEADREKPKEELKMDARKTTSDSSYTIPLQMH